MNQLVIIQNRQAVTTSLQVAESFEKEHRNVLRDIDALKVDVLNFEQMFFETETPDKYGRPRRTYLMNRDGFTLLAMGFTGQKAIQFKLAYIQAFNEMERQLTQPTAAELIAMLAQQGVEQERRLNAVEKRTAQLEAQQENITEVVSLNIDGWKNKVSAILNRIAIARGGGDQFRKVRSESYELLEKRGKCRLNIRLENLKKEAQARGICSPGKIRNFNKIDVIEADTRLTEIYLAIVKEMAIAHKVNAEGLGA